MTNGYTKSFFLTIPSDRGDKYIILISTFSVQVTGGLETEDGDMTK